MLSFLRFNRGKRDQKRRRSTTSWSPALESLEELILLSPTPGQILPSTRDITPPIVNLVTPQNRSTVYTNPTSSTLTLTANASDTKSGIASVQFFVDGRSIAKTTTAPYSISWNTKNISGRHTIKVVARDGAGNVRTSAPVVVKFVLDKTPPSMTLNPPAKTDALQGGLTAAQKRRAEQLISLFENGTINFQ
ncbi:MAG: Ig-like domain-containing protein, partial [Isosphaeraceae bacterium]